MGKRAADVPAKWWENYDNIILLTSWMAHEEFPGTEIARAVEKPWDYDVEWQLAEQKHTCAKAEWVKDHPEAIGIP